MPHIDARGQHARGRAAVYRFADVDEPVALVGWTPIGEAIIVRADGSTDVVAAHRVRLLEPLQALREAEKLLDEARALNGEERA